MARRLGWKAKIAIAIIAFLFFLLVFVFLPSGQEWMKEKITEAYKALPEDQRRESRWAGCWQFLAFWRGSICGELEPAYDMYKEFCGLGKGYVLDMNNPRAIKFVGLCSPDGKSGWGPLHPDAPDAYCAYLELYQPNVTSQTTAREAIIYYTLFYDWHIKNSPEKKPHPKFNKNWVKVQKMILDGRVGVPEGFDYSAKKAAPWVEGN